MNDHHPGKLWLAPPYTRTEFASLAKPADRAQRNVAGIVNFHVPSNNVSWADDYASAQQQVAQSGKPIILFFTAKWCVPCRIMKRSVWADEQVEATVNAGFTPVTIDVDDPDAAAALSRYRVGATPTTIITDPQGKVLERVEGGIKNRRTTKRATRALSNGKVTRARPVTLAVGMNQPRRIHDTINTFSGSLHFDHAPECRSGRRWFR